MPQETSLPSSDVQQSVLQEHIILAIVCAVIFGLLYEGVRKLLKFRKLLSKRDVKLRAHIKDVLKKAFARDKSKPLSKREIERSIQLKLPDLDKSAVVFSIDKKKALTSSEESHYATNGYHFSRYLRVLQVLDGGEQFFIDACGSVGKVLRDGESEIDRLLYLDKPSDSIFCGEVSKQNFPNKVRVYCLGYNEGTENSEVIYRENELLEGQNIAILTAFALCEKPLVDLANFVRSQGANLVGVGVLFEAAYDGMDLQTILKAPVVSAISVDLKHCNYRQCLWCPTKPKIKKLEFNAY